MTTVTNRPSNDVTGLMIENVRIFLQVKNAFDQCDSEIKSVVSDMIDIATDESALPDERERALLTVAEAIFPSLSFDFLSKGQDMRLSPASEVHRDQMKAESISFSKALGELLEQRGMSQDQLAKKIGVSQPAIANMLNRNCKPQRKTVIGIADALSIAPEDLWPGFNAN